MFYVLAEAVLCHYTAQRTAYGKLIDVLTGLPKKPKFTNGMRECVALWGFRKKHMADNIKNKVRHID